MKLSIWDYLKAIAFGILLITAVLLTVSCTSLKYYGRQHKCNSLQKQQQNSEWKQYKHKNNYWW